MKIYKENKVRLTVNLLIFVIVIPTLINLLIRYLDKELYNEFNIAIHILFLLIGVIASTQYSAKIEVNEEQIARNSTSGCVSIKWEDLTKLKHIKLNNRIILFNTSGKKLYFSKNIINYKSLYQEIYQEIKLHKKESVVDNSFIIFINRINRA